MWKVGMGCKRARRILLGVAAGRERCRIRIGESRRTRIRGINWGLKIFGSVRRGNKESHPPQYPPAQFEESTMGGQPLQKPMF